MPVHAERPEVQRFRETACVLQLGRHVNNAKFLTLYPLADEVVANVDVFDLVVVAGLIPKYSAPRSSSLTTVHLTSLPGKRKLQAYLNKIAT